MMLSLGQAQIPGLRNVNQVHHLKQVDKKGKVRVVKKSMASILDYLRWDDERVFQSSWVMEDGTMIVLFSNVIKDTKAYVTNWMMCPAANIHWFLGKRGCDEEDAIKVLEKCFSPNEVTK